MRVRDRTAFRESASTIARSSPAASFFPNRRQVAGSRPTTSRVAIAPGQAEAHDAEGVADGVDLVAALLVTAEVGVPLDTEWRRARRGPGRCST